MIRVCYGEHHQGDRKIGEKPPFDNHEETHGLCDACFEHEKIEIQLALKRLRDAGWHPEKELLMDRGHSVGPGKAVPEEPEHGRSE